MQPLRDILDTAPTIESTENYHIYFRDSHALTPEMQ